MTKMWAAVMYMAIALDMKKDAILTDRLAARVSSGMREGSTAEKTKAQGRCATDTTTCSDGEVVQRDPANTCRFASCGTSLVQESSEQPTYSWDGVSISDDQNFCTRMTSVLGDYNDQSTDDCGKFTEKIADCPNHYVHILDGNVGDIEHCRVESGKCTTGAIHNCTWSFYMEDLIKKHGDSEDNCAAKLLEAKRSLDGLLHSVQDVYNQLMQWNAIVQAENGTIRGLLQEQQEDWDVYVSQQATCDSEYTGDQSTITAIKNEMTELRAIANPDVRSAVDVKHARGYQSSGTTSESCPAAYPFVSAGSDKSWCCLAENDVSQSSPNCQKRDCRDERENVVACVNNAKANGAGVLAPSQTAAAAAAAFTELDEGACQTFSSFVERVQKKHGLAKLSEKLGGSCSDSGLISGQPSTAEGGMGSWSCYNRNNGNPHGNCHTHSNYNGHSTTFHIHGSCHGGTQGGIRQTFPTASGTSYKLKFECFAGAWDGGADVDFLEVSTDGGSTWQQYGCDPGAWHDIEHSFTTSSGGEPSTGQTDFIIWADAHECIDVDNIILEKCEGSCHEARNNLKTEFELAFNTLGDLYTTTMQGMEENRTICLNTATYDYKAGVEGLDGIDDQIQDAAGKIHEAQGEIARLEPMLHDVERAVDRMRAYVETIATECGEEGYLGVLYGQIRTKIVELQECPGRNDFIINVPHWTTKSATTPAPTPWYDSPMAESVRSQL